MLIKQSNSFRHE